MLSPLRTRTARPRSFRKRTESDSPFVQLKLTSRGGLSDFREVELQAETRQVTSAAAAKAFMSISVERAAGQAGRGFGRAGARSAGTVEVSAPRVGPARTA